MDILFQRKPLLRMRDERRVLYDGNTANGGPRMLGASKHAALLFSVDDVALATANLGEEPEGRQLK
jgi:hypothetical protein